MKKHDEYTLYKKESGDNIIRFMMAPYDCWAREYKAMKTKPFLVVKYPKDNDDLIPRIKGDRLKRQEWINKWVSHTWYTTTEKALTKYKSL